MTKLAMYGFTFAVVFSAASLASASEDSIFTDTSASRSLEDFQPFMASGGNDSDELVAFASRVVAAESNLAETKHTEQTAAVAVAEENLTEKREARGGFHLLFEFAGIAVLMGLVGMVRVWTKK